MFRLGGLIQFYLFVTAVSLGLCCCGSGQKLVSVGMQNLLDPLVRLWGECIAVEGSVRATECILLKKARAVGWYCYMIFSVCVRYLGISVGERLNFRSYLKCLRFKFMRTLGRLGWVERVGCKLEDW